MRPAHTLFIILCILPLSLLAQAPAAIPLDEEALHHLVLKNNTVKVFEIDLARGGWVHAVRNIGQTAYHSVLIDLLRTQTGARNLCGAQVKDMPANCPGMAADANAPRTDVPQFETDQVRVTLTRIRPRQQAIFGDPDRDNLIVAIDEAAVANQKMPSGGTIWIARGDAGRVIKNNSDKEIRVVSVACKP